jgi:uncharacterized repeat protein (TIGR03806 family)
VKRWYIIAAALLIAACAGETTTAPAFHANENPDRLSEWGMIAAKDGALILNSGVTPYDLATPLFSDYAQKLRTVWLPDGKPAQYSADGAFDFPVGTVITKTFYYVQSSAQWDGVITTRETPPLIDNTLALTGIRLIETRILVHRKDGWAALPYVWNDDQTDAMLKRTGAVKRLTLKRDEDRMEKFAYVVPNANQCAGCHATNATTKAIKPIGPKARHLNKQSTYHPAFNQLDYWLAAGLLTIDNTDTPQSSLYPEEPRSALRDAAHKAAPQGEEAGRLEGKANVKKKTGVAFPQNAIWTDETAPLDSRARAYLDINCSHCHNPNGAADTSGLDLEPGAAGPAMGRCKLPIAVGGGSGGRPFDIVPGAPEQSITIFRMETTDPGAMMPELGRSVAHEEGVALIAKWIEKMEGRCG